VVPSLIVIAFVIPLITIIQIHPDGINLQLNYRYTHSLRRGSWDSGTSTSYTDYEISEVAKLENLSLVLNIEIRQYPVWINVSSWDFGDTVRIANQTATIMWDSERYGFGCWIGELENGTDVYYSKEFGVFLGTYYHEWDFSDTMNIDSETYKIELTYENLRDLYRIDYAFNFDALIFSTIIIESAVIIWIFKKGWRGLSLRKS
jgi:hypothetical protein